MGNSEKKIAYVLYLKYCRIDPIGVFDSDEALKDGIEEAKRYGKTLTDDSFIIKEFEVNKVF